MITEIKSFFANIRRRLFERRVECEIYGAIFPHIEQERDCGYPFDSEEELLEQCCDVEITSLPFVRDIERDIKRMPRGYGQAFRYILYRDLKTNPNMPRARIKMYRMLARERVYPTVCDPRFVATRA